MYIIYTYIEQMQVTVNSNNKLALGLFCSIGFGGVIFIQSLICLFLYLLVCLLTCIIITIFFFSREGAYYIVLCGGGLAQNKLSLLLLSNLWFNWDFSYAFQFLKLSNKSR